MISIAHKIELVPNNKQKTYFHKAFGCYRLAYNWGILEWKRRYEAGERCSAISINNAFNAIKGEQYPFVYEVTKYACSQAFRNLEEAYKKFFRDLKKGELSYPKFKKKKDRTGSFYIGGDASGVFERNKNSKSFKLIHRNTGQKCQYLKVPRLGCVKMTERLRFEGKIHSVTISLSGGRYYASFNMEISEEEYKRTHPTKSIKKGSSVGIDMGVATSLILSDGICINGPRPLEKALQKIKKENRQLDKRVHARTKQDSLNGVVQSNNYKKLARRLSKSYKRVSNIRWDFIRKVSSIIIGSYYNVSVEDIDLKDLLKKSMVSRSMVDVSFGLIRRTLEKKAEKEGVLLKKADKLYPSSKTCSRCGAVKRNLTLRDRVFQCDRCGFVLDRDFNASLNLQKLLEDEKIGVGCPEFTPVDLTALLFLFKRNGITTSKVESGKQQKILSS